MSSPSAGHRAASVPEQLAEGFGLDFQLGDAGALAGNAEKFNVHGDSAESCQADVTLMIAWAFGP